MAFFWEMYYVFYTKKEPIPSMVKSAYKPSGPSGQSSSWVLYHEATRSISTPPWKDASPQLTSKGGERGLAVGRWTCNPENPGSNLPPCHWMDLSSVAPNSTPPRFVNSQLVSLPPVGILNLLCLICIIFVKRIWSYSHGICAIFNNYPAKSRGISSDT